MVTCGVYVVDRCAFTVLLLNAVAVFVILPVLIIGGNQTVCGIVAEVKGALGVNDGGDVACIVVVESAFVCTQCLAGKLSILVVVALLLATVCPRP